MSGNISASILARLLTLAKQRGHLYFTLSNTASYTSAPTKRALAIE